MGEDSCGGKEEAGAVLAAIKRAVLWKAIPRIGGEKHGRIIEVS